MKSAYGRKVPAPYDQIPLHIRAGSIIPMNVDSNVTGLGDASSAGKDTVLIYPYGSTSLTYHRANGNGISYQDVTISMNESTGAIQISSPTSRTSISSVCHSAWPCNINRP